MSCPNPLVPGAPPRRAPVVLPEVVESVLFLYWGTLVQTTVAELVLDSSSSFLAVSDPFCCGCHCIIFPY